MATPMPLRATIVCTSNQLEEEPWLPVRGIITLFRIQVVCGEQEWEDDRRYSDFHELNEKLAVICGYEALPELPPKLLLNQVPASRQPTTP